MTRVEALTLDEIRALYRERMVDDFPPDELKPLNMIESALARDQYACYGLRDGEDILAYAYFAKDGRRMLVDYYAVRRDLRDEGFGSRFIQALIRGPLKACECVLLEIEDPDAAADDAEREHRLRRRQFYLRNGLWETGVNAHVYGVEYRLLALPVGVRPDPRTVRSVYAALYRAMLPEGLYEQWVRI